MIIEVKNCVNDLSNTVKIETDFGVVKVVIDLSDKEKVQITQEFEKDMQITVSLL